MRLIIDYLGNTRAQLVSQYDYWTTNKFCEVYFKILHM